MSLDTERKRVAHLLRRAGLGASRAELAYYEKLGVEKSVNALLDFDKTDEGFDLPVTELANPNNDMLNPPAVAIWWIWRMLVTKRPLQEKMTLFWHNHFACGADKVGAGPLIYQQNEMFRRNAVADFRTMLLDVSKDPAMILYLDTNTNVKGKPNENYARELMELFTMGIGNYTEKDIQEAARAFTGWTLARPRTQDLEEARKGGKALLLFTKRPRLHDDGEKTVLGQTGAFDGEDIVEVLLEQPATAKYMCAKLWKWFAYYEPEERVIDRLTKTFRSTGFSVKAVLRDIFTSREFYSDKAERALYKSPVDFAVGVCRALAVGDVIEERVRSQGELQRRRLIGAGVGNLYQAMSRMGMQLLYPPDVSGWDLGETWINSATMIERIKFADSVFGRAVGEGGGRRMQGGVPAVRLFGPDPPETAEALVDRALEVLDVSLPEDKKKVLREVVNDNGGPEVAKQPVPAQSVAHEIAKLVFASPEFQFC